MFDRGKLSPQMRARLDAALARQYQFTSGRVMSLGAYLECNREVWTHKSFRVRRHSQHKIGGCYTELKTPVTEYTLWLGDQGIDVPKLVYDTVEITEV